MNGLGPRWRGQSVQQGRGRFRIAVGRAGTQNYVERVGALAMVRLGLLVVGYYFGCGIRRAGGGGRDPDWRGRPDDRRDAWFGEQYQRGTGTGGRGSQRRWWRARRAGAADHGGRLLRSRASGRRRPEAGQRWRGLRRRALVLAFLDPGLEGLRGGRDPDDRSGRDQLEADRRRRPERVPRVRPRRSARDQSRRLSRRPLDRQEDRDSA